MIDILTPRQNALFLMIKDACLSGAPTPTQCEMSDYLTSQGFPLSPGAAGWEVQHLVDKKMMRVLEGGKNQRPIFQLNYRPDAKTVKRARAHTPEALQRMTEARASKLREKSDWPIPTKASAAQYDAAMKLGKPIRIQGPADEARRTAKIVRPYGNHSLTGCSAEMVAL